jgi:cytochrome c-type biogenesis protein
MMDFSVLVAFTAGLFSFLSPCVLPLVPSYARQRSFVVAGGDRRARLAHPIRPANYLLTLPQGAGFTVGP